jgi:hypothetical protein
MFISVFTSDLAEALAKRGRPHEALATIEWAISQVESIGTSFDMPEMLRLKGAFLAKAGSGYLIDQFLRATTNRRTDRYGGPTDNRIRFLAEVTRAVASEVGATRTGVRLAPYITLKDMADPEVVDTVLAAAEVLADQEIAYIHLAEADWDDAPVVPEGFREGAAQALRQHHHRRRSL